jgi:hypothetical protein
MRSRVFVTLALLSNGILACAGQNYWKEPVGVSDKAEVASDQSVGMDGGDDYACAHEPGLLEGRPCAPEGKTCGAQNSDPHQISETLVCRDGEWDRETSPAAARPASSAKP